jgi:hypothetical protein
VKISYLGAEEMTITMMNLRLLPSYTTERYYILSEIEDRAAFEALDTDAGICLRLITQDQLQ